MIAGGIIVQVQKDLMYHMFSILEEYVYFIHVAG